MTDKLKLLLGITGEDRDDILSFALETATDMALGYCNLDELPPQLENTVVRMAADRGLRPGSSATGGPVGRPGRRDSQLRERKQRQHGADHRRQVHPGRLPGAA